MCRLSACGSHRGLASIVSISAGVSRLNKVDSGSATTRSLLDRVAGCTVDDDATFLPVSFVFATAATGSTSLTRLRCRPRHGGADLVFVKIPTLKKSPSLRFFEGGGAIFIQFFFRVNQLCFIPRPGRAGTLSAMEKSIDYAGIDDGSSIVVPSTAGFSGGEDGVVITPDPSGIFIKTRLMKNKGRGEEGRSTLLSGGV